MKIASNETKYSTQAIKTIATRIYAHLKRDLTPDQLNRIDWKNLHLHIGLKKSGAERCYIRSKIELAIRNPGKEPLTEYTLAYYVCGMLCWRAQMKNVWDHLPSDNFSNELLPLKSKPKPRPKEETPEIVQLRKEYEKAERAVNRVINRLDKFKIEQQKLTQKKKRAFESLKSARKKYKKAHTKYLATSEQTAELDTKGFAARMRARRDAEKT